MLSTREVKFTEYLLAQLTLNHCKEFPFVNDEFQSAVQNMASVILKSHPDIAEQEDLDILFRPTSQSGEFRRFINALDHLNGRRLSLENPFLVKAKISITEDKAQSIIGKLGCNSKYLSMLNDAAQAFVEGLRGADAIAQ